MDSQEEFWAGDFGEDYMSRNNSLKLHESNVHFFESVFRKVGGVPVRYSNLELTSA